MKSKILPKIIITSLCIIAFYAGYKWATKYEKIPDVPGKSSNSPDIQKNPAVEKDLSTIIIGVIEPKTGIPAGIESTIGKAAQLCTGYINENGGINGKKIKIVEYDSKNTSPGSIEAAHSADKDGAAVVMGGWYSSNSLAIAGVLQKLKIPFVAVGSTNPEITKTGDYIFTVNFSDSFQGAALAEFAYDTLKAKTAVVLTNADNAYSPYLSKVFIEQFTEYGGKIAWHGEYIPQESSYRKLTDDLLSYSSDVIFIPGYESDAGEIVKLIRKKGIKSTLIGGDGWRSSMIKISDGAVTGGFFTKAYHINSPIYNKVNILLQRWTKEYGEPNRDITILALDACGIIFEAIKRTDSPDRQSIRDAIASTRNFSGIIGNYSFDSNRTPERCLHILKMTETEPAFVELIPPKKLKIGIIFSSTGERANTSEMGFESAEFAANEINDLGGILGYKIDLVKYDNKGTAIGAAEAAEQAAADKVAAVIGGAYSNEAIAMAMVLQKYQIPMISPTATALELTRTGDYIFRACFTDQLQGEALARFALEELAAKTVITITNVNSEYCTGLTKVFSDVFRKKGKIFAEKEFPENNTDFNKILEDVKKLNPDIIFFPGYTREVTYAIAQARNMGIKTIFLGGDGWDYLTIYQHADIQMENNYSADHWHIEYTNDRSRQFVENYHKTHKDISGFVAITYDCMYLLKQAIISKKSIERKDIRDGLAAISNFEGISGSISFDENRDPRKPIFILKYGKDKEHLYKLYNKQD